MLEPKKQTEGAEKELKSPEELARKREELFKKIEQFKGGEHVFVLVMRVMEHCFEDGVTLVKRLNFSQENIANLITEPSIINKHERLVAELIGQSSFNSHLIDKNVGKILGKDKMDSFRENQKGGDVKFPYNNFPEFSEVLRDVDEYYLNFLKLRRLSPREPKVGASVKSPGEKRAESYLNESLDALEERYDSLKVLIILWEIIKEHYENEVKMAFSIIKFRDPDFFKDISDFDKFVEDYLNREIPDQENFEKILDRGFNYLPTENLVAQLFLSKTVSRDALNSILFRLPFDKFSDEFERARVEGPEQGYFHKFDKAKIRKELQRDILNDIEVSGGDKSQIAFVEDDEGVKILENGKEISGTNDETLDSIADVRALFEIGLKNLNEYVDEGKGNRLTEIQKVLSLLANGNIKEAFSEFWIHRSFHASKMQDPDILKMFVYLGQKLIQSDDLKKEFEEFMEFAKNLLSANEIAMIYLSTLDQYKLFEFLQNYEGDPNDYPEYLKVFNNFLKRIKKDDKKIKGGLNALSFDEILSKSDVKNKLKFWIYYSLALLDNYPEEAKQIVLNTTKNIGQIGFVDTKDVNVLISLLIKSGLKDLAKRILYTYIDAYNQGKIPDALSSIFTAVIQLGDFVLLKQFFSQNVLMTLIDHDDKKYSQDNLSALQIFAQQEPNSVLAIFKMFLVNSPKPKKVKSLRIEDILSFLFLSLSSQGFMELFKQNSKSQEIISLLEFKERIKILLLMGDFQSVAKIMDNESKCEPKDNYFACVQGVSEYLLSVLYLQNALPIEIRRKLNLINLLRKENITKEEIYGVLGEVQISPGRLREKVRTQVSQSVGVVNILNKLLEDDPTIFIDDMAAIPDRNSGTYSQMLFRKLFNVIDPKRGFQDEPIDPFREVDSTCIMGGDPLSEDSNVDFSLDSDIEGILISNFFGKYHCATDMWDSMEPDDAYKEHGPKKIVQVELRDVKYSYSILLPKPLGSRIVPESIKCVDRCGKELNPEYEVDEKTGKIIVYNPGNLKSVKYSFKVLLKTDVPQEVSKKDFEKFLEGLDGKTREVLREDIVEFPLDIRMFLDSIKNLDPLEKLLKIEAFVPKIFYYDVGNTQKVSREKEGQDLGSQIALMAMRMDEIKSEKPKIADNLAGKRYAGVCADSAKFTVALLRKAGMPAGIIDGFHPTVKQRHACNFVLWPDGEGGNYKIVPLDTTPSASVLPGVNENTSLDSLSERIENEKKQKSNLCEEAKIRLKEITDMEIEDALDLNDSGLKGLLDIVLHGIKKSNLNVVRRAFDFARYASLDINTIEGESAFRELIEKEIKDQRELESGENAGPEFVKTIKEYARRYSEDTKDLIHAFEVLEKIVDLTSKYLKKEEILAAKAVIKFYKNKVFQGKYKEAG